MPPELWQVMLLAWREVVLPFMAMQSSPFVGLERLVSEGDRGMSVKEGLTDR